MIDNFVPQPYPLECAREPASPTEIPTWSLVLGWQRTEDGRLVPVLDVDGLQFRQAAAPRTAADAPRATSAASVRDAASVRSAQPRIR